MYVGHFAIGLALKARLPDVPSLPILLGVGFLDVVDGIFVTLGLDRVTANLQAGPFLFFDLTFIDWDHSLATALFWSLVWSVIFMQEKRVAATAFLAAISHFVADWPMHNHDLALYPYSKVHLGFGLWGKLGTWAWILEGLFSAALVAYAWKANAERGVSLKWPLVVLVVLFFNLSPWLSPMKLVATLSEPTAHIVQGILVTIGFLVPGWLLVKLVDRAETRGRRVVSVTRP